MKHHFIKNDENDYGLYIIENKSPYLLQDDDTIYYCFTNQELSSDPSIRIHQIWNFDLKSEIGKKKLVFFKKNITRNEIIYNNDQDESLIFTQNQMNYLVGFYQCSYDQILQNASLLLQNMFGDCVYDNIDDKTIDKWSSNIFPSKFLHYFETGLAKDLLNSWKILKGMSKKDTKFTFDENLKSFSHYGSMFWIVETKLKFVDFFGEEGIQNIRVWIGVGPLMVVILHYDTLSITDQFGFGQIHNFKYDKEMFSFESGNDVKTFYSSNGKEITESIQTYLIPYKRYHYARFNNMNSLNNISLFFN